MSLKLSESHGWFLQSSEQKAVLPLMAIFADLDKGYAKEMSLKPLIRNLHVLGESSCKRKAQDLSWLTLALT